MSTGTAPAEPLLDRLERIFVLKISRTMYLGAALLSVLTLLGAMALAVYSFTPTFRGWDPPEPEAPTLARVNADEVRAALSGKGSTAGRPDEAFEIAADSEPSPDVTPTASNAQEISTAFAQLRAQFDTSTPPWLPVREQSCTSMAWWGECLRMSTKTVQPGIQDALEEALANATPPQRLQTLQSALRLVKLTQDAPEPLAKDAIRAQAALAAIHLTRPDIASVPALDALEAGLKGSTLSVDDLIAWLDATSSVDYTADQAALVATWVSAGPRWTKLLPTSVTGDRFSRRVALMGTWTVLRASAGDDASARVDEMIGVLESFPADDRVRALHAYGRLVHSKSAEAERAYLEAQAARALAVTALDTSEAITNEFKSTSRSYALAGVAVSLSLIAILGLFLALLAVERNTRALMQLQAQQPKSSPA